MGMGCWSEEHNMIKNKSRIMMILFELKGRDNFSSTVKT